MVTGIVWINVLFWQLTIGRTQGNIMATYSEMFDFVIEGNLPEIVKAIDNGFDVNEADEYGYILLHRACVNHQLEIVSLLIQRGSNLEKTATDDWTPLHLAAVSGASGCFRLLVNAGANPNRQDCNGRSPLHLSITGRNPDLAAELINLGSSKQLTDSDGLTPLELAQQKKATEFYEVLS